MRLAKGENIKIVTDAGETIFVERRHLEYVENQVYRALLRPVVFRTLMPVGSYGVPEWAETATYDRIVSTATWRPVEWAGHSGDIATSSVKLVSGEVQKFFAMRSGYSYDDRELLRAQQSGISLDPERALAVTTQAQIVLDEIAFKGTASLTDHPVAVADSGVYGIANLPGVNVDSSLAGSAAENWDEIVATAISAGTADAFMQAINILVLDMLDIEGQIQTATKQNVVPDTFLMPLSYQSLLRGLMHPYSGRTAEAIMLESCQFINSFRYWHRLETGNAAGNGKRCIAYNRTDERVVRCQIMLQWGRSRS